MPIFDIFSKRQRALRGDVPDTYRYDDIPNPLRVQIIFIMEYTLGNKKQYTSNARTIAPLYDSIVDILRSEYGVFRLPANHKAYETKMMNLINFFLETEDIEKVIDVIEISFRAIDNFTRTPRYMNKKDPSGDADRAIEELNSRFKEHGVGYCFTSGRIIRIDSEFAHSEMVKPALKILDHRRYAGAQQEFLSAHKHYREGNMKEAINECLKSLESVMKSICDKRKWQYDNRATASTLIKICFDNELVPRFWQSQFDALRSLLESGIPTARNRLSGHGQGPDPKPVPHHIAGYVLHMTAATIVFLA